MPKVDNDVIAGRNEYAIEGDAVANFEVASFSIFRDFPKDHFLTVKSVTAAVV